MKKRFNRYACLICAPMLLFQPAGGQIQEIYSHGSPSGEEQYMLELINRARANPGEEGRRLAESKDPMVKFAVGFFKVDLARLKREFASYPVRPPVAMNAGLLSAARRHSADMAEKNFQSHTGSDGSSMLDRLNDAGYSFSAFNESIYSNLVPTVLYAHSGLNIDWGTGPGGIQPGLGHRMNIMNFGNQVFKEVGIGVVSRTGAAAEKYGKLAVTQDYGSQRGDASFLLGVAYYDVNKNGICDPGEGLSGIDVRPDTGDFHARTSGSGGYAIPFTGGTGPRALTFSGGGLAQDETRPFTISSENVKVDLKIVSGPAFVHLEVADGLASEAGNTAAFRVARVGPVDKDLKVVMTRPVSGKDGIGLPKDYRISAVKPARASGVGGDSGQFSVVIPKGQRAATVKITAEKDGVREGREQVVFRIKNLASYRMATPGAATISITD